MREIILKKAQGLFFVAFLLVTLSAPHLTGATVQENEGGGGNISYALKNPLAFDSIEDFVVAILNVVIVIATPIVVLFIIFAGFKYVTARGNPGQIQEATQALTYAIIGGVLIIGAVAISKIIGNLVTAFGA
ncbi:MAG: hypothetical protein RL538_593 [Candidatus Parcubacteria bacterium]|jgi:hypothetical protein